MTGIEKKLNNEDGEAEERGDVLIRHEYTSVHKQAKQTKS
jgi:hypothetical protein